MSQVQCSPQLEPVAHRSGPHTAPQHPPPPRGAGQLTLIGSRGFMEGRVHLSKVQGAEGCLHPEGYSRISFLRQFVSETEQKPFFQRFPLVFSAPLTPGALLTSELFGGSQLPPRRLGACQQISSISNMSDGIQLFPIISKTLVTGR